MESDLLAIMHAHEVDTLGVAGHIQVITPDVRHVLGEEPLAGAVQQADVYRPAARAWKRATTLRPERSDRNAGTIAGGRVVLVLSCPVFLRSTFSRSEKTEDILEHDPHDHPDSDQLNDQDRPYIPTAYHLRVLPYHKHKEASK